jgi:NADH:ubiquinone oxidoreductase subunit F (NADH-binding)/(2Fe-2S) ferredoxin/NAD-dependent dihydropyrimidine dehydrogenase PreA subunit
MTDSSGPREVLVCQGTGCASSRSPAVQAALEEEVDRLGAQGARVKLTGCHGFCQQGPIVVVEPDGVFYQRVEPDDATDIVERHLCDDEPVDRLFYRDPTTAEPIPHYRDIPFYKGQQRVILRNCGRINPEEIGDYVAAGGYRTLAATLADRTPDDVVREITASGLRGRGGAGFPTGVKWGFCRAEDSDTKYVVCNADEGDPGAFMDRSLLEADPHAVIEGMALAGYAIGASQGYVYARAEYPLAIKRLRLAIEQAREEGFLGAAVAGTSFAFDLDVFEGAGAFVCGEETALMASIEGDRGAPTPRPPFPAQAGLWGKPTLINNVKTLATVPVILDKGAEWFAAIGAGESKGTAVFALTGNIANSGLIEVPMGTSLRRIVYDIGGGIPDGKRLKAVQTGGPSGGCLPAALLHTPVDYESLRAAGSIMGSGGMVVMDEDTCMVDVARFFLDFTQKESCGKCGPCRLGTRQMLDILEDITQKRASMADLDLLVDLGEGVKLGSLCGLGQTAPNPILTTLRYFRDEVEAHVEHETCPAGMCRDFVYYRVIPELCVGCKLCAKACPQQTIAGDLKTVHVIDQSDCIKCGLCFEACPPKIAAVERLTGPAAIMSA